MSHPDFWEEGQTHRAPGRGPRAASLSLVTLTGWVLKETLAQPDFCPDKSELGLAWLSGRCGSQHPGRGLESRTARPWDMFGFLFPTGRSTLKPNVAGGARVGPSLSTPRAAVRPPGPFCGVLRDALLPARFLPAVALGEDHSSDTFTDDGKAWTSWRPRSHWGLTSDLRVMLCRQAWLGGGGV